MRKKSTAGSIVRIALGTVLLLAVLAGLTLARASLQLNEAWSEAGGALPMGEAVPGADAGALQLPAAPQPEVLGNALTPVSSQVTLSVAAALPDNFFYRAAEALQPDKRQKTIECSDGAASKALDDDGAVWGFEVPEGCTAALRVTDENGAGVYDGAVTGSYSRTFTAEGTDTCMLTLAAGQGRYDYSFSVSLHQRVEVSLSSDTASQGDVVAVEVTGNFLGEPMTISTELGLCDFVPVSDSVWAAFVPVAYNRDPGTWPIEVTVGDNAYSLRLTVETTDFPVQYMTIDEDIADSTWNSAAASAEYRAAIYPLYELTDNEKYWDGLFIEPVTGYEVSTQYGLWRYTNGVYSERHGGVDLACALGTPVVAPQNGVVLYAGFLQLTGNTVVIAHGGGVKSMFYHMNSLSVATGDRVTTGQKIGEVGTTGYSTGPHLHYEVKIGNQSINPFDLFDGTSGLYAGQNVAPPAD